MSRFAVAIDFPTPSWPFGSKSEFTFRPKTHHPGRRRGYDAAVEDRLNFQWTKTLQSSDQVVAADHRKLVARSRDVCRNNPYAKSFLHLLRANVVGPNGIKLRAQPLNNDNEIDLPAAAAIEAGWREWGRPENADLGRTRSFRELQELFITTLGQDGEFLAQIIEGEDAGPWHFSLRPIDPSLLPVSLTRTEPNGNHTRFGIEHDKQGRVVAYWLAAEVKGLSQTTWEGRKVSRIDARHIIHAFIPMEVGQKRGIPMTATALMRLRMVGAYEKAALVAARLGASKIGHYLQPAGSQGFTGDDVDAEGNLLEDIEPGVTRKLPPGVTFEGWDPAYPIGEFGPFVKRSLQGIAAGLNVTYHALSRDLQGFSFSTARVAILEEREHYKTLQEFAIERFVDVVYRRWLTSALLQDKLLIGNAPLNSLREDKYRNVRWRGRRWAWVDPQKDATALGIQLDRGMIALSDAINELGRDPEETWKQIAADQKRLDELGIELTPQTTNQVVALLAGPPAGDPTPPEDPED